jgi:hypothetical protein
VVVLRFSDSDTYNTVTLDPHRDYARRRLVYLLDPQLGRYALAGSQLFQDQRVNIV